MQRNERISWKEVEMLIDILVSQFNQDFDAMLLITRGGIIPGGMLAESMDIEDILTAAVDFPAAHERTSHSKFLMFPTFLQFPKENLLIDKQILIVDDVWGSGRTITAVKNRVEAAHGIPFTTVLHFNPYRNLFGNVRPDYYGAITDAHIVYPWEINHGLERVPKTF
jgi:hypothetical protein